MQGGSRQWIFPLSFLPDNDYFILHDLRLWDGKHFFQIDVLILHAKYALILEVKNIIGELYLDTDLHQMIRIKEEEKEAFPDPIIQVNRLKRQFEAWLLANQFPIIPIYSLVVFSNPKSILRLSSPQIQTFKNTIIHKEYLPKLISKLTSSYKRSFLPTDEKRD
ncbi:nuclease-related domain-containing protein [Niallia sp. FSL K6-0212]|uniref:nuclease-related domain-containing protein n=1 Tax=Niallia sp. FSL K6-0212 TaxID=2921423 RepID=UPI0030F69DB1